MSERPLSDALDNTSPIAEPAPAGRKRSKKTRAYLAIALILVGVVAWDGFVKRPTGPAQGEAFHSVGAGPAMPATLPTTTFRVGTFNIAGGMGRDGKRDLARAARVMQGCDLLGIQEAHGVSLADGKNQAQILGEALQMPWLYAPTERRWWHEDFGNAVITRLPVRSWSRVPISARDAQSNRNAVVTRVEAGGKIIHVLVTHVGRHEDHAPQMRAVVEQFLSLAEPAILMGDLNTIPDDPQIARLRKTEGVVDAVSIAVEGKFPHHVDWIFTRGLKVLGAGGPR